MAMPERGEIWLVRFDPSEGDEIRKIRPAAVMTASGIGKIRLHIVIPITGWQPQFARYAWMIKLTPESVNGLSKESAADAFQIKSVSIDRFQSRVGHLSEQLTQSIAAAVALCIGYSPRK
jgi:mRNA interferase MazF